jgi:hypothetical protein
VTPLGHLAVSFLLGRARAYTGRSFALCLAGAFLPDLVDKPLVALGVTPVAHSVGHSVFLVALGAAVVPTWSRLRGATPLVVGWAGHVAADLIVAYPTFLVNYGWPLLEPRPTPDEGFVAYWLAYAASPVGAVEAAVVVAAIRLFLAHRRPVRGDDA